MSIPRIWKSDTKNTDLQIFRSEIHYIQFVKSKCQKLTIVTYVIVIIVFGQ